MKDINLVVETHSQKNGSWHVDHLSAESLDGRQFKVVLNDTWDGDLSSLTPVSFKARASKRVYLRLKRALEAYAADIGVPLPDARNSSSWRCVIGG